MSDAEIAMVPAFGTGDHAAAYRVRNMLLAAAKSVTFPLWKSEGTATATGP